MRMEKMILGRRGAALNPVPQPLLATAVGQVVSSLLLLSHLWTTPASPILRTLAALQLEETAHAQMDSQTNTDREIIELLTI